MVFWGRAQPLHRIAAAAHLLCEEVRHLAQEVLERLVSLEYRFGLLVLEPLGALRTACKKEEGAAARPMNRASAQVEVGIKKFVACIGQLADLLQVPHTAPGAAEDSTVEDEFDWLQKARADLTPEDHKAIGLAKIKDLASEFDKNLLEVVVTTGALKQPIGMQLPALLDSEWVSKNERHAEALGIPGVEAVEAVLITAKKTLGATFNGVVDMALETAKEGVVEVHGCVRDCAAAAADEVLGPLQSVFVKELIAELYSVTQGLALKLGTQYFEKLMRYASPHVQALTTGKGARPAASHIREVAVWSVQRIVHALNSTIAANTSSQSSGHTKMLAEIADALTHALHLAREMNKHDKDVRALFERNQHTLVHSRLETVARNADGMSGAAGWETSGDPAHSDFLANLPVDSLDTTEEDDTGGERARNAHCRGRRRPWRIVRGLQHVRGADRHKPASPSLEGSAQSAEQLQPPMPTHELPSNLTPK